MYAGAQVADVVTWQNRIVRYGTQKASLFRAHPLNFRRHPARQETALSGSLETLGWIDDVIITQRGVIIDGHERVEMALRNGDADVPFKVIDISEAEEAQALLSLDPIAALAQTDAGKVDELLRLVDSGNEAVQEFLSNLSMDVGLTKFDPTAEWEGMPEFEQEDMKGFQAVHVHFKTKEDRDTFSELIGQKLGDKTRAIWYPEATKTDMKSELYQDEP
jgi:hypothetical protein